MHFSYDVELPLGSWDCCKTGPMEPRAELLSPEALLVAMPQHSHIVLVAWRFLQQVARTLPKRNLVEYLHKVPLCSLFVG